MTGPYIPENALSGTLRGSFSSDTLNEIMQTGPTRFYGAGGGGMRPPLLEAIGQGLREMAHQEEFYRQYAEQARQAREEVESAFSIMQEVATLRGLATIPDILRASELSMSEAMERHSTDREAAFQQMQEGFIALRDRAGTDTAMSALTKAIEENPELAEFLNDDERYHEFVRGMAADRREGTTGLAGVAQGEAAEEVAALQDALETEDDPELRTALEAQIAEVSGFAEDPAFGETEVPDIRSGLSDYVEQSRRYNGEIDRYRYNRTIAAAVALARGPSEMAIGGIQTLDLLATWFWRGLLGFREEGTEIDSAENRVMRGFDARLEAALDIMLPSDRARQEEFVVQLGSAGGSLVGFYLLGAMGIRGPRLAAAGSIIEGSSGWEEAYALEAAAGQRLIQLLTHMGLGATEAWPIDVALGRMAQQIGTGRFTRILATSTASSMEELIQELVQAGGSEFSLYWGLDDPIDWEAIGRQATIGFITGGGAGLITGASADIQRLQDERFARDILPSLEQSFAEFQQRNAEPPVILDQVAEGRAVLEDTLQLLDLWNRDGEVTFDQPLAPGDIEPGALPLIDNAPARVAEAFQPIMQPPREQAETTPDGDQEPGAEQPVERVPMGILGEVDAQIAQPIIDAAEEINLLRRQGQPRPPPVMLPPERVAFNLRQNQRDRTANRATYTPRERIVLTPPEGSNLPPVAIGDITFDDWIARTETMLSEDEVAAAARWYDDTLRVFQEMFPGNEGLAENYMIAWLAGQVQQSPAGAALDTLRQNQNMVEGREGDDRLKNSPEAVADNVMAALRGEPLTGGVAAKISDFIDSGLGRQTRSWVGNDPAGGAPFVVDRHTARDMGVVDGPYQRALERRGYTFPEGYEREVDKDVNAKGPLYENRSNFGRDLTDHLNGIEWMGRSDWQPREVQAVGWISTLRLMGQHEGTPRTALDANTFHTAFEVAPGGSTLTARLFGARMAGLDLAARTRIMEHVGGMAVAEAREATSVLAVTPLTRGTGSWEGVTNPSAVTGVFATADQAMAYNAVLGYLLDQEAVASGRFYPLAKSHKAFSIQILLPPTTNRSAHQRIFEILQSRGPKKKDGSSVFEGFMPFTRGGRDGFAMMVDGGTKKGADAIKAFFGYNSDLTPVEGRSEVSGAMGRAGFFDASAYDIAVSGADIIYTENDWEKGYQGYDRAHREATGRPLPERVHRARAEIQLRLAQEIVIEEGRRDRGRKNRLETLARNSGTTPFADENGRVRLTHWSPSAHRVLDPTKAGTGPLVGGERASGWKHVFFGIGVEQEGGYRKENTGHVRHEVTVDGNLLYNLTEDPLGLGNLYPEGAYTEMQRTEGKVSMVQALGFKGYINPDHVRGPVVGLFNEISPDVITNDRTGEVEARRDTPQTDNDEFDAAVGLDMSLPRAARPLSRNYGKLGDRIAPYEIDDRQQQLPLVGDTAATPFRNWFRGSWVTDGDGQPLLVHHGTWKPGFTRFNMEDGAAWFSDELETSVTYGKSSGNDGTAAFGSDLRRIVENGQEFRAGYFRYRFRRVDIAEYEAQQREAEQREVEDARQRTLRALMNFSMPEILNAAMLERATSDLEDATRAVENGDPDWAGKVMDFRIQWDRDQVLYDTIGNLQPIDTLLSRPPRDLPDMVRPILESMAANPSHPGNYAASTALAHIDKRDAYWIHDAVYALHQGGFGHQSEKAGLYWALVDARDVLVDDRWAWDVSGKTGTGYLMEIQSYAGPTFSQERIEAARQEAITALEAIDQSALETGVAEQVQTSIELAREGGERWARRAVWSLENAVADPLRERIDLIVTTVFDEGTEAEAAARPELERLQSELAELDNLTDTLTGINSYMQAPGWQSSGKPETLRESIKAVRSLLRPRGANTYDAYLRITNPYVVDFKGSQWNRGPAAVESGSLFVPIIGSEAATRELIGQYVPELMGVADEEATSGFLGRLVLRDIPREMLNDEGFLQRVDQLKQVFEGLRSQALERYANAVVVELNRIERMVVDGLDAWVEEQVRDRMDFVTNYSDKPIPETMEADLRAQFQAEADEVRRGASAMPLSTVANLIRTENGPKMVASIVGEELDAMSKDGLSYVRHAVRALMVEVGANPELLGVGSLSTSERALTELFFLVRNSTSVGRGVPTTDFEVRLDEVSHGRNTRAHVQLAKQLGHDGVIIRNVYDTAQGETVSPANVFVVFEANQIKAAGANAGTYSLDEDDILAAQAAPPSPPAAPQRPQGLGATANRAPYRGEPTRPDAGIPTPPDNVVPQPQRNLIEIAKVFRRAMRLTVAQGRLTLKGPGIQGQYSRKQGTIRLQNINDVSTLFHEGGHALHDAMDGPLRDTIRHSQKELFWLADNVYEGDLRGSTKDKRIREGFAEGFRLFVQNREQLRRWAPEFTRRMEEMLTKEDPQLLQKLTEIGEMYRKWTQQPTSASFTGMVAQSRRDTVLQRTQEVIEEEGFKEGTRSILRAKVNGFLQDFVNDRTGLNTLTARLLNAAEANRGSVPNLLASQDPAKLATMTTNFGGRALGFLTDGVRKYHSDQITSRPLSDALDISQGRAAGVNGPTNEARQAEFAAYLIARRALDEVDRGTLDRFAINQTDMATRLFVKEMETKYGNSFREAADIVHEYSMALWQRMYDAGLLTQEQFDAQKDRGFYVPLMRDMSDTGGDVGAILKRLTNRTGRLSRVVDPMRGSDRQVIDPLQSLITKTISIEQMIAQNEVRQALGKLADMGGRHAGRLVERVPSHDPKVTNIDVTDIVRKLAKSNDISPSEALEMQIAMQPYLDAGSQLSVFRMEETSANGDPIVFYRDKGKVVALEIRDQEVAGDVVNYLNAFGGEDVFDTAGINILTNASRVFRAGVTSWPDFILVNFVRDQVQAWASTDVGYLPFATGMKGVYSELAQRDMAKLYNYHMGIMGGAGQAQYNEARVNADLNVLRGRGYVTKAFGATPEGALAGWTRITEVSETGTRLGLFEKAFRRAKAEGMSDYDAGVEAAYLATDYMNYGLHGASQTSNAVRRLIPFLNANIVGLTKMWRVLGNTEVARRKGFKTAIAAYFKSVDGRTDLTDAEKRAVNTGRKAWVKMMSLGVLSALLHYLFEDDEDYQQTSEYLRQTGWVVPLGDGEIFYIPKPFEWAIVANAVERGLEYTGGDELALQRFMRSTAQSLMLPTENPLLSTIREIRNNYDPFFERELIPFWLQGSVAADASLGVNAYTSQLARDIGGLIDKPPIYVDHFLQNMGASMARDISTMYDQAFSPVDMELSRNDAPILRRFFRDSSRGSVVMQDFWDQMSGRDGTMAGAAAAFGRWIARDGEQAAIQRAEETLTDDDRVFAFLQEYQSAAEKRLHPMRWAQDYGSVLSAMRTDIRSQIGLADTELQQPIDLTPSQRTEVSALLSDLSVRVARNALIMLDEPGWSHQQPVDLEPTIDLIREVSPDTAAELDRRLQAGRVYTEGAIRELWPEARERLLFDGPTAVLDDLSGMARHW